MITLQFNFKTKGGKNMRFQDKLFQLRKKSGMTQAELAEALHVSRQAISKWEMGITVPDINNMISISKIFEVSIDDLINEELEIEKISSLEDKTPETAKITLDNNEPVSKIEESKTTSKTVKVDYSYLVIKIIIIICIAIFFSIIGIIAHIPTTMFIFLIIIGLLTLVCYGVKLLILFFTKNK